MTEKERRRHREEVQKRIQARRELRNPKQNNNKALFLFRAYITVIIAGSFLIVSFMNTDSAQAMSEKVKAVISQQIPLESIDAMAEFKEKWQAFFKQNDILVPVFDNEVETDVTVYKPDLGDSP